MILTKLIVNKENGKILGTQIIGAGDVDKRLDVIVTAIMSGGTVKDVADLDLGYVRFAQQGLLRFARNLWLRKPPSPYANAIDNIAHAANIIRNKIDGLAKSLTPMEVKAKMERGYVPPLGGVGGGFILLDVRTPPEVDKARIEDARVKLIPLGNLRARIAELLPKDKEIIIFCAISLRGYEAQRILEGYGFTAVKFMDGGIAAWPY